jgi:hypothetical protein
MIVTAPPFDVVEQVLVGLRERPGTPREQRYTLRIVKLTRSINTCGGQKVDQQLILGSSLSVE